MNNVHTEPTLFDVKFVGRDGCAYGSKWRLAMISDVLHTIFTETTQDEDDTMFTIEEKGYTQQMLVSWLSITHNQYPVVQYYIDECSKFDDLGGLDELCELGELDCKNRVLFIPSVLLCRKYNMSALDENIISIIIDRRYELYDEVCLQLIKNNVFDRLISIYACITLFYRNRIQLQLLPKVLLIMFILENRKLNKPINDQLQEASKDVLIMFILKNRDFTDKYCGLKYSNTLCWWLSMFEHRNPYIESSYTADDVECAINTMPGMIKKRRELGIIVWRQFNENKKKSILPLLHKEWKKTVIHNYMYEEYPLQSFLACHSHD